MKAPKEYRRDPDKPRNGSPFVVGIDPGLKGGVVVLDTDGSLVSATRMPTMLVNKRRVISASDIISFTELWDAKLVVVEEVGTFRGEGPVGAFSFGRTLGTVEGMVHRSNVPLELVRPKVWQRYLLPRGAGTTKERAVCAALSRWPELQEVLRVKVGWDIADAALIAEYGRVFLSANLPGGLGEKV